METITLYANEDLTTLERGFAQDPIDMPESETMSPKEYVIPRQKFIEAYSEWDREKDPLLEVRDELSRLQIWLSQSAAAKVYRALQENKESVELY